MAVNFYLSLVAFCLTPGIICTEFMAGGYSSIDPNRQDVKEAANFAVEEYNKQSNYVYQCKLMKTLHAESQVVNGIKYKLNMEIGRTQCRKNHASGNSPCDTHNSPVSKVFSCTFVVYQSPQRGDDPPHKSLQSHDCHPK